QVEHVGEVIRLFPAFGQMRLDRVGAGRNLRTDLKPQQRAVDKAQGGIGLGVVGEVVIEVHRVIAAHAQDAPTLGWDRVGPPERGGTGERHSRHREAGRQASLQQRTTADLCRRMGRGSLGVHTNPSLECGSRRTGPNGGECATRIACMHPSLWPYWTSAVAHWRLCVALRLLSAFAVGLRLLSECVLSTWLAVWTPMVDCCLRHGRTC